jgi:hypothetical protein
VRTEHSSKTRRPLASSQEEALFTQASAEYQEMVGVDPYGAEEIRDIVVENPGGGFALYINHSGALHPSSPSETRATRACVSRSFRFWPMLV